MLVLALDTATPSVVAGVIEVSAPAESGRDTSDMGDAGDTAGVRAARDVSSANRHAETLGQVIPDVLGAAGVGMADLAAVVVGLGPGPFTGLRVGVITAAAMGDALGLPVHGVCTHDAMAAAHTELAGSVPNGTTVPDEGLVVVTDARRRECYWAAYDASGTRISGPHVQRPEQVAGRSEWHPGALVIGDPAFSEVLGIEVRPAQPDPMGLVLAARGLDDGQPRGPLEPLYLRRPDTAAPSPRKRVTPR